MTDRGIPQAFWDGEDGVAMRDVFDNADVSTSILIL
ncbi:MAG: hypothetical protein RIS36_791 [Pseudomonadota bacterium]